MTALETAKHILANIHNVREAVNHAYKIRTELIQLALEGSITELEFYNITSVLTPQSRSPLWEKYYIQKRGAKKLKAQDNKGDFILDGKAYEYKASGFNQTGNINIVQLRSWQKCDYIVQYITSGEVFTFRLTRAQMEEEANRCKKSAAHGTQAANLKNENIEFRFTVVVGGEDWNRWLSRYRR